MCIVNSALGTFTNIYLLKGTLIVTDTGDTAIVTSGWTATDAYTQMGKNAYSPNKTIIAQVLTDNTSRHTYKTVANVVGSTDGHSIPKVGETASGTLVDNGGDIPRVGSIVSDPRGVLMTVEANGVSM
jgi:hypothetical protein